MIGYDSSDTSFDTIEETGGSKTTTLVAANIQKHYHSFAPAGTVSSVFTWTAGNTGYYGGDSNGNTTAFSIQNNILLFICGKELLNKRTC